MCVRVRVCVRMRACVCVCVCACLLAHLLRKVESSDAQGPEAAEHGEKGQAQVVLRDHQREVAFAVCIAEVINGRILGFKQSVLEKTRTIYNGWNEDKSEICFFFFNNLSEMSL